MYQRGEKTQTKTILLSFLYTINVYFMDGKVFRVIREHLRGNPDTVKLKITDFA